jgi:hypothetical protein
MEQGRCRAASDERELNGAALNPMLSLGDGRRRSQDRSFDDA